MNLTEFARLFNVDGRTVTKWETGKCKPNGASEGIFYGIHGFIELYRDNPERVKQAGKYIKDRTSISLAYMLICLLEAITVGPDALGGDRP